MNTKTVSKTDVKKTSVKNDGSKHEITKLSIPEMKNFHKVLEKYMKNVWKLDTPISEWSNKEIGDYFERYVADVLRKCGYKDVQHCGKPGDGGIDITMTLSGKKSISGSSLPFWNDDDAPKVEKIMVQCKYHTNDSVGVGEIRKARTSKQDGKFNKIFFITTTGFSADAEENAIKGKVEMYDGKRFYEELVLKARKKGFMY